ncbi:hypothetical protein AX16_010400 [Volvariella volvacea WC 439]|nr:hypothetical protein AX16_010400 [Volvariella volvacea WC 439]
MGIESRRQPSSDHTTSDSNIHHQWQTRECLAEDHEARQLLALRTECLRGSNRRLLQATYNLFRVSSPNSTWQTVVNVVLGDQDVPGGREAAAMTRSSKAPVSIVGTDFDAVNGSNPALPNDKYIIRQCRGANVASLRANPRAHISGVKVVNAVGHPLWVKFGTDVSLFEARTQHYVAQVVSRNGDAAPVRVPAVYRFLQYKDKGYIVMDFVDGSVCTGSDAQAVAAAVSFLITIPAPADQRSPGPVGGGPICHDFFIDRKSSVMYPTVELLTSHINGILRHQLKKVRVNLVPEVQEQGLRLCLSDTNRENFMVSSEDKKIVAIDFGASCFLPISFFEMALYHPDNFTRRIREFVIRPRSTQETALSQAATSLVKYQSNMVGEYISIVSLALSLSAPCREIDFLTGLPAELKRFGV